MTLCVCMHRLSMMGELLNNNVWGVLMYDFNSQLTANHKSIFCTVDVDSNKSCVSMCCCHIVLKNMWNTTHQLWTKRLELIHSFWTLFIKINSVWAECEENHSSGISWTPVQMDRGVFVLPVSVCRDSASLHYCIIYIIYVHCLFIKRLTVFCWLSCPTSVGRSSQPENNQM